MNQDLISIVLEDDVVVSSFFFLWLIRAINTYYTSQQIHIHMELLNAINKDIEISKKEQILRTTNIDEFYEKYAAQGSPVILGISLAKQNYDIVHHPVELEIRNNYSPFLLR